MARATIIRSVIIGGLSMIPYESFWLCRVEGEACVELDVGAGVTLEAFLKIAASGELGDRPRSSVHSQNNIR